MKLPTDKCSKYKIINSLNTLSVAGKITDGNKRGPYLRFGCYLHFLNTLRHALLQ